MARQLHFSAFVHLPGHHEAAWRERSANPLAGASIDAFVEVAEVAERAKFDAFFLPDSLALGDFDIGTQPSQNLLHPALVVAAIAAKTSKIGLFSTASTTFSAPFDVARTFNTLDIISNGRAGWNIVTSALPEIPGLYGRSELPGHKERYERADEFVELVLKLWSGWAPEAIVGDKAAGIWANKSAVQHIRHNGRFWDFSGIPSFPASPQGRPLLIQAGSSQDGREFAARFVDVILTGQPTIEGARKFYNETKSLAARFGRVEDQVVIMPGLVPVVGRTHADARRILQDLNSLIVEEAAIEMLARVLHIGREELKWDEALPDTLPSEDQIQGKKSKFSRIVNYARQNQLTVRQLVHYLAGGRGHLNLIGSAEEVADAIEVWFETRAADGFTVMPLTYPGGLSDFTSQVIPILQERGLFRVDYGSETLRGRFGLPEAFGQRTKEFA